MRKKRMKQLGKSIAATLLAVSVVVTSVLGGVSFGQMEEVEAFGIGALVEVVKTSTKVATAACNLSNDLKDAGSSSATHKFNVMIDSLFGTNFSGETSVDAKLDNIYDTLEDVDGKVDEINQKTDEINKGMTAANGKLDEVNSKLDKQSQTLSEISEGVEYLVEAVDKNHLSTTSQIASMESSITQLINENSNALKVAIFNSQLEMLNANTLLSNLDKYYEEFSGLSSTEETILSDLKNCQDSYQKFVDQVAALENGEQILEILNKFTLNYEESYKALTAEEKKLLDTKVQLSKTETKTANAFVKEYMEFMYKYMTETIFSKGDGFTSNIYDVVKEMGEYIVGNVKSMDYTGVGEVYYKLGMINYSTNAEVHKAYQDFMMSVLQEYYTTAYLCQMSLAYKIAYDEVHDGNHMSISTDRKHLNDLYNQVLQVQAYYGSELKRCIKTYDFNNYKDGELEKNLCYYGNTINAKDGINGWKCLEKTELYKNPTMSSEQMVMTVAESRPLYFYQGAKERTSSAVWTSSDDSIAVVNKDGIVTAVGTGVAEITASFDNGNLEASCIVSVTNGCFIADDSAEKVYHYGKNSYKIADTDGGDYYYNTNTYSRAAVELTSAKKSVSLVEATGLTESEIALYKWSSLNQDVAGYKDGQITLNDKGNCVVMGYRYLEEQDIYECITIPVKVSVDTSSAMESDEQLALKDYADYTKISTKEQLIALANDSSKWGAECKYLLTNDIDLGGMEWTPIGYEFVMGISTNTYVSKRGYTRRQVPFMGVFEGNGHTISNFKITRMPYQDEMIAALQEVHEKEKNERLYEVRNEVGLITLGFFGYTDGASVQNLNLEGVNISIDRDHTGKSFTLDGESYTLAWADHNNDLCIYAGSLTGKAITTINGILGGRSVDSIFEQDENERIIVKADADVDEFTKNIPENIKKLGRSSSIYAMSLMEQIIAAYSVEKVPVYNCTAKCEISIPGEDSKVGGLYGANNQQIVNASVSGTLAATELEVDTNLMDAGIGGIVGCWLPGAGVGMYDCKADITISDENSASSLAGGLIGVLSKPTGIDISKIRITSEEVASAGSNLEVLENKANIGVTNIALAIAFSSGLSEYIDLMGTGRKLENNLIEGCQVYGSIKQSGMAGGLIGMKYIAYQEGVMEYIGDDNIGGPVYQTNVDINECYVNADIKGTGMAASGLVASLYRKDITKDENLKERFDGNIKNCYVYGTIEGAGMASGAVSYNFEDNPDSVKLSGIVIACTKISGTENDSAVYPVYVSEMPGITINSSNVGFYKGIQYKRGTLSTATSTNNQGEVLTDMNSTTKYLEFWGGNSFCDLTALDYTNGAIPEVLKQRYFFNIEKARKYYHVGDTFEPITSMTLYTGVGTKAVTSGITSTTPDMSEPGIRKVTVSYGKYSQTYTVYIYPVTEAYLKVTEKPSLVQKGNSYTISGGKVSVYNTNGIKTETVSIDNCKKEYENGYVRITYKNLSTAVKVAAVMVYSNNVVGEKGSEQIAVGYYLEGAPISKNLVPESRTVVYNKENVTVKLLGSSLKSDMKATGDMYVTAVYESCVPDVCEHEWKKVYTIDKKATTSANGLRSIHCSKCDEVKEGSKTTIYKIASVGLEAAKLKYNGKTQTPVVVVKDSKGNVIDSAYYTVSGTKSAKNCGKYTLSVTFKTRYSGSKSLSYSISPAAPANTKAVLYGYDDVKLTWSKSTGATSYNVYYKKATDSKYTKLGNTTATSYQAADLADGVKYNFKIAACYGEKVEGTYASTVTISTLKKLSAPTVKKTSSSQVTIGWTNIEGETGYQISCSSSSTGTSICATVASTSAASKVVSVKAGKKLYYKVRAYVDVDGTKIYGPWSNVTSYYLVNVGTVSGLKAQLYGYNDVKVSWNKVTGANQYVVYYKTASASSYAKLVTTTNTSYQKANLSDGVKYIFKVVPRYVADGKVLGTGTYKAVGVTTLKKLNTPTISKASSSKVKVAWNNIEGETGYQISCSSSKTGTSICATVPTTTGTSKQLSVKAGKTLYYKVRAYVEVNGEKIYGPWSEAKAYNLK